MSERRKINVNSSEISTESDRQFLERTGASAQIRDAMAKIIENRPQDPVAFLADYFESFDSGMDTTTKAYKQIILTHYSKPAFETNLRIAYDILSTRKVAKNLKGINGAVYLELLDRICKGFPSVITERLMHRIGCRSHEAVIFDVFKSGIFTCFVLKDYLSQAEGLFMSLDMSNSGKVSKVVGDTVLQLLTQSINGTKDTPNSVLESGYSLSPDKIFGALVKNMTGPGKNSTTTMNREQFLIQAADTFLSKVNKVK